MPIFASRWFGSSRSTVSKARIPLPVAALAGGVIPIRFSQSVVQNTGRLLRETSDLLTRLQLGLISLARVSMRWRLGSFILGVNGDFYVFKERLAWLIAEHDLFAAAIHGWTLRAIFHFHDGGS